MLETILGDITKINTVTAIVNVANCYFNSLRIATKNNIRTIAFPSISTGAFHFPVNIAANIAASTVKKFLDENPDKIDYILWVLFDEKTERIYKNVMDGLRP